MCVVVAANLAPAMPRQARKGSAAAVPNSGRVNGSGGLPRGDVIVTAAMRQPLDEVRNLAEQAIGRPLVIEYGSARGNLKQEILAGRSFEVALLPPDVDADLTKADKILPGIFEIARDPVGVGLHGNAPSDQEVSTPESLKRAMLNAKSRWPLDLVNMRSVFSPSARIFRTKR
jgi:hypothetical protein